jgi:hypothetical protein
MKDLYFKENMSNMFYSIMHKNLSLAPIYNLYYILNSNFYNISVKAKSTFMDRKINKNKSR